MKRLSTICLTMATATFLALAPSLIAAGHGGGMGGMRTAGMRGGGGMGGGAHTQMPLRKGDDTGGGTTKAKQGTGGRQHDMDGGRAGSSKQTGSTTSNPRK